MKRGQQTVVLIPARGGSKSIPYKNIKEINDRPLIYWTLDAAVNCDSIDKVFVSTDSDLIKKTVQDYQSEKIEVVGRSPESSTDTAKTETVMLEFAEQVDFDVLILIQATSPLLQSIDLACGIEVFNRPDIDSVMSVARQKRFLWQDDGNGIIIPKNYDPNIRPRRQDFSGYLVENGAFYITSKEKLLASGCRISGKIGYVEMHEDTYFEVDEPSDWLIVEQLLKKQTENHKKISLNNIKMFLTDCDGVLTDGGMYYSENGDELKKFNTKDGMGFQLLKQKGIKVGIITGENMALIQRRALKLSADECYMGIKNKARILNGIIEKYGLRFDEIAYVGDDINDLELMKKVGFACSVADGMECVKKAAHYITNAKGGAGAVREIAELIVACR